MVFRDSPHPRTRLVVASLLVAFGVGWLAWAWHADLAYCERHLLPDYTAFTSHDHVLARTWRLVAAALGVVLLVVAPFAGRWAGRVGAAEALAASVRMGMALVLSLAASEIGMRALHLPRAPELGHLTQVRIGQPDPRYGWIYVASKATTLRQGGRDIEYAIDADHDRAASTSPAVDPARPTILFAGESITAGHGLAWGESYPALVGRTLDVQVADLAVHGYGSDQAFLRLHDALPRFARPVAIVSFYIPAMLARVEYDDHPRLVFDGGAPTVVPVHGFWHDLRLAEAWRYAVPYRGDGPIELVAQILRETDRLARERGAKALFVAPRIGSVRMDAALIDELFTRQGLHVLDVDYGFEPLPDDNHPNAASTRRLADAVAAAIRSEIASQ